MLRAAAMGDDGGFLGAFARIARDDPARVWGSFDGTPLNFGTLAGQAGAVARWLAERGIGPGDPVAVMMGNAPQSLAMVLGLAVSGAVWVPVNPAARGPALAHLLADSGARLILCDPDCRAALTGCGAALPPVVTGPAPGLWPAAPLPSALPAPDRILALMYTSGTTGPAKGVPVTHRMLRLAAEGVAHVTTPRAGDIFFLWEPIFHIGGAQVLPLPALKGIRVAMTGRFSASRFWAQVEAAGATHVHYLGGILQMLLKQPPTEVEARAAAGLRMVWGGGCPAGVFAALRARFPFEIRECYGMTEMSSITTAADGSEAGVVGRALPWFTVTIRDNRGRPVPAGQRGEITVETTDPGAFFAGYHRNPAATARTLRDGRLHTGDLGSMTRSGVLSFHGRLVESFRVRGENVSAWEVEHVAAAHPGVAACAVTGVAAEVGEQELILFYQPAAGADPGAAALHRWLRRRLAPHQCPRFVQVVDGFDRTPSQRIMKHRLPDTAAGAWDARAQGAD
ncbi:MAG: class I adenylate-forming enzyme family protein [Gemmobacter sp.]